MSTAGTTTVRDLFDGAVAHLTAAASAIDAINVYPVPDGDTGSNMSATLREAVARGRADNEAAGGGAEVSAVARGALWAARGNSGVILSQALRGFAEGVGDAEVLDAARLAAGLDQAARRAYGAVAEPQEGTMLTVLRAAGEAAMEAAAGLPRGGEDAPCSTVLDAAIAGAEAAEAKTIEQLPALAEAGVTDSGGEGICTILRGVRATVRGEPVPESAPDLGQPTMRMAGTGHDGDSYGFCTEFLLERTGEELDIDALRAALRGEDHRSVVVVGDAQLARVHVHTSRPNRLIEEAGSWGEVSRIKVDDMSEQSRRFRAQGSGATGSVAVLSLSRGHGFDEVFESLGATVSDLGANVKPAAGMIASAADALRVPDVIVLPNHKNVLMAAEQAVGLSNCTLRVLPTTTLAGGVAAMVAFDPKSSVDANLEAMRTAMGEMRAVEVTVAITDRTAEGIDVHTGDGMALVDTKLVGVGASPEEALFAGIEAAGGGTAEMITVYLGAESTADQDALASRLGERYPDAEIETVDGGQGLYHYVASVE